MGKKAFSAGYCELQQSHCELQQSHCELQQSHCEQWFCSQSQ